MYVWPLSTVLSKVCTARAAYQGGMRYIYAGMRYILLRGTVVNRTYDTRKNLYTSSFLLTIFGPINYGPP